MGKHSGVLCGTCKKQYGSEAALKIHQTIKKGHTGIIRP